MPFGRDKKLTKEDLVELGIDPDKLKDLQEKGIKKEDLEALKTELTTGLTQTITDQIKAGFTELEGRLPKPVVDKKEGTEGTRTMEDEIADFTSDPVGYIQKKNAGTAAFAAVEVMKSRRQIAFDNALSTLTGFKNAALRTEIEEEWKKYTPEVLVRNGGDPVVLLKQVHDMIIGKHHDEIQRDRDKKDGKYNLVHSGGSGGSTVITDTSGGGEKKKVMSAEDKEMAKKYGMTEEEWLKADEDMEKEEEARRSKVSA